MSFRCPISLVVAMALATNAMAEIRKQPLTYSREGKNGFTRLPPDRTGITFQNLPEDSILNGSGVAAGDFDGDGWCDLYFCRLAGENVLYRNRGGWQFEDVTVAAKVGCTNFASTGAVFADVEGDGDLDLLVTSFTDGTRLFINDGQGRFEDQTSVRGLSQKGSATSMALADTDADGDLDLYVAYIRAERLRQGDAHFSFGDVNGERTVVAVNGRPVTEPDLTNRFSLSIAGQVQEHAEPDIFYRNNGHGYFTAVPWTSGVFLHEDGSPWKAAPYDWGLAVQFYDLNDDRAPDIYVCNDYFTPDRVWINQRNGTFKELPARALHTISYSSMSVDFGDLNRDGHPDGYVVEMISRNYLRRQVQVIDVVPYYFRPGQRPEREQVQQNTLLLNRGDTTFAEIARLAGVEASEWSWCTILMDVDMDGWEDILVSNGHGRDLQNADAAERVQSELRGRLVSPLEREKVMMKVFEPLKVPKVAFRNNRNLTFSEHGAAWGFHTADISHGMALADLDNDGDMDLAMNNLGSPAGLYRNDAPQPRVAVRLKGEGRNQAGVGARILVDTSLGVQRQEIICGGRYLSGDQMQRTFAAGRDRLSITIHWPSGRVTKIPDASADCLYEIAESSSQVQTNQVERPKAPLFQDVSRQLGHWHQDKPADDWEWQPSLLTTLTHLGPGISWHDLNNDRWPDLVIPAGRGGTMGVYTNRSGAFAAFSSPALARPAARDQTSVLGLERVLIAGTSNYEDGTTNGGWARMVDLRTGAAGEILAHPHGCTGPMAMADLNGDGALDLFVGTRAVSRNYPATFPSTLYLKKGNRFEAVQSLAAGLVSGAVFSDLDLDGDVDLAIACVWGPIRTYRNEEGRLVESTDSVGLSATTGLWNGIATADFNSDGRPDIIASNWGRNSRWQGTRKHPLKLYYGDFDGNGILDMADACFDETLGREVPYGSLRFLGRALPELHARMPTFRAFATASLREILNKPGVPLEAVTLETTLFLNAGGRFVPHELPIEAQFTPAFGVAPGDFDGDGHEDLFLAQNFFGTNLEMPRPDPGRGLLLLGDGRGGFRVASGTESGLDVPGEGRGCATADFDRDGRLDLAVGQNSGATKLFRNQGSARCLAVTLVGAPPNTRAVGAALRYTGPNNTRRWHEIQHGSGYWSANSPTLLLGRPEALLQIEVRFPGKAWQPITIPPGAWAVTVEETGKVDVLP